MKAYLAEHEITYLASTTALGGVAATIIAFLTRGSRVGTRFELWAVVGGFAGLWFGVWMIVFGPVL